MRLGYSDRAERNLDDILAFIRMDRPMAAARLLDRIRLSCDQLRRHPQYRPHRHRFRHTRARRPKLALHRRLHRRRAGLTVTIVNIFHGARQRREQD